MGLAVGDKQMWLRAKATARDTLCLSSRPAYFTPFVKRASSVSNHERNKIRNACIKQHRGAFPVTTVAARSIILSNRTIFFFLRGRRLILRPRNKTTKAVSLPQIRHEAYLQNPYTKQRQCCFHCTRMSVSCVC